MNVVFSETRNNMDIQANVQSGLIRTSLPTRSNTTPSLSLDNTCMSAFETSTPLKVVVKTNYNDIALEVVVESSGLLQTSIRN